MRTGTVRPRHSGTALVMAAAGGFTLHYALGDLLARATRAGEDGSHRTGPASARLR